MYGGQVVEEGDTATIISEPPHPYTRALLEALPQGGDHAASCAASPAHRRA